MTKLKIILVRHGQPDYPVLDRFGYGYSGWRRDFVPLSPLGVGQMRRLAVRLSALAPIRILASPYTRTLQSAWLLAAELGGQVEIAMELYDWLPISDGSQPLAEPTRAQKSLEYRAWRHSGSLPPTRTWETDDDIRERVAPVLTKLAAGNASAVIVTHEAVIRALTGKRDIPLSSMHSWKPPARGRAGDSNARPPR